MAHPAKADWANHFKRSLPVEWDPDGDPEQAINDEGDERNERDERDERNERNERNETDETDETDERNAKDEKDTHIDSFNSRSSHLLNPSLSLSLLRPLADLNLTRIHINNNYPSKPILLKDFLPTTQSDDLVHQQLHSQSPPPQNPQISLDPPPENHHIAHHDWIRHLKSDASSDILKAQALHSQLSLYDRLIALRISLQKSIQATNLWAAQDHPSLSHPPDPQQPSRPDQEQQSRQAIAQDLLKLSSLIGQWRTDFISHIPHNQETSQTLGLSDQSDLEKCLSLASSQDQRLSPYLEQTMHKWFNKINVANQLQRTRSNKLDQTDPIRHLQSSWSDLEQRNKLIQRNQMIVSSQDPSHSNSIKLAHPHVFDDHEFYKSLLKQVVESNHELGEGVFTNDYRAHRAHRPNLDRKSTKARKLNFDPHPKLVSFMVPISNEAWNDEQKDDLFGSLLGVGFQEPVEPDGSRSLACGNNDLNEEVKLTPSANVPAIKLIG